MQAGEALRSAQIELARTYEHPFYWAPFIGVGGSSASNELRIGTFLANPTRIGTN